MPEELQTGSAEPERPPDSGLKRLLTYTFVALVLAVLAAFLAVNLVIRWFGQG